MYAPNHAPDPAKKYEVVLKKQDTVLDSMGSPAQIMTKKFNEIPSTVIVI
jgi:hypothetical protein